jgi:transporter family protein
LLGAVSGLYDKFIIARIDRIAVQAWFSFYQVVILLPILAIFWFPGRKKTTPFRWRWAIPAIGLTLVIADFLYFYALSMDGSMISIIAALRRVSVLVTFAFGAFILGEVNLKQKGFYLLGILAGTLLMTLGSS